LKYGSAGAERLPAITVRWLVVAALLIALLIGLMQWAKISPMRQIDAFFYDSFIVLGSQPVAEQPVTLVNIDDNSLQEVGQWPWPRYKLAQLLEAIHAGKPAAVGIDVIFPEADRTALAALRQAYRREFGLELALDNIPPVLLDNDVFLGAVMGEAGAIGAIHLLFDQTNVPTIQFQAPRGIQLTGRADALKLEQAQGLLQSVFKVQSQTRFSGFINMKPDFDGKVRRLPLLLRYQDKVYPHLLLAGLMRAHGVETVAVERDSLGWLLKVGPHAIPVAVDGSMLLRFHEPGQPYRSISALELLRSATPPGEIAGKVVYVGTSAAALHDFINTPIDAQFPGLSVYAVGMSNIVGRDHLREPEWGGQASLALSLLCGTVIAVLFVRFSRRRMWLAGSAGLLLVIVLGSGWLVSSAGIYLSPSAGVLSVILCFMWLSVARYAIEKKRAFAWLELVNNTQRVAIESMSAVAETRDPETGGHIKPTQFYVRAIGKTADESFWLADVGIYRVAVSVGAVA
jgi:adenylate cyclase